MYFIVFKKNLDSNAPIGATQRFSGSISRSNFHNRTSSQQPISHPPSRLQPEQLELTVTSEEWNAAKHRVTDEMRSFSEPFVSPLTVETPETIRLEGTGSYVQRTNGRLLLSCEHVAREQPIHYRFNGSDATYEHPGPWTMDRHPFDVAFARITDRQWAVMQHRAESIPSTKFADLHRISHKEELLFFRGYAYENSAYGFGQHDANGTGYCSQEVAGAGDDQLFELFWDPQQGQITTGTTAEAASAMSFDDPGGFSGSLVWNTRYLEMTAAGKAWSPEDALVTGLLRRWDDKTKTLLVWRVEHLSAWLRASV
jgi:hypothetical protein